jgi:hypothetical protein
VSSDVITELRAGRTQSTFLSELERFIDLFQVNVGLWTETMSLLRSSSNESHSVCVDGLQHLLEQLGICGRQTDREHLLALPVA